MHYRSLLWIGPVLLFSTATAVCMLGWDGKVRTILSISMPYAGKKDILSSSVNILCVWCPGFKIFVFKVPFCTVMLRLYGLHPCSFGRCTK